MHLIQGNAYSLYAQYFSTYKIVNSSSMIVVGVTLLLFIGR
jgi:hypothetical protein